MAGHARPAALAESVVLSYRAADTDPAGEADGFPVNHIVHDRLRALPFRAYLRRAHSGPVTEGEEWGEFVNCGCGTTRDVVLRVETVDCATHLGEATALELTSLGES